MRTAASALLFLGIVLPAARAGEADFRRELDDLRREVANLKSTMLEQEIDAYLTGTDGVREAQGAGAIGGLTFKARFTMVFQGTIAAEGGADDIGLVDGDVDLDVDFEVTDRLRLFVYTTANNSGTGSLPANFGATRISTAPTLAGVFDGIGVNGTVPTNPGSVTVREAGISVVSQIGGTDLHWEMGELDPRDRFLQNAYGNDENSQFVHNSFDDPAAVPWITDSTGRTSLGWHLWLTLGDTKQFTINWGWFAPPGQWFQRGQFYLQLHWKGELGGRETNLRIMGFWQNFFRNASDSDDAGGGISWDWKSNENVGFFLRAAVNGGDLNPVELDASVGWVFFGIVPSRPDDSLGVAVGFIQANTNVMPVTEDTELTVEIFYKYVAQDGKLQITPHLIYVSDPGGGSPGAFTDDTLFIAGMRIHVPF